MAKSKSKMKRQVEKIRTGTRRHHNTKGLRQIKNGKTRRQMQALARKLGILYGYRED